MSKNGNKIALAGGASRVGCAALTVTAAAILTASTLLAEPFEQTSPEALISALESVFGSHPGLRKNHAKGMCATGSFVGLSEATSYSRSALFSGATIPVVARFSLGGGDPNAPDAGKGPRGMGLEFRFADGGKQHMTMINAPMFLAAVPKTFLDNLLASKPGPATGKPDPAALKAFAATHPESAGMTKFYADHNPPPSYANSAFQLVLWPASSRRGRSATLAYRKPRLTLFDRRKRCIPSLRFRRSIPSGRATPKVSCWIRCVSLGLDSSRTAPWAVDS